MDRKGYTVSKYEFMWSLRKDTLKPRKIKRLRLEEIIPNDDLNDSNENVAKNAWKYFVKNSSLHGVKYFTDDNFTRIERIFWKIIVFVGFASATCIICSLYNNYQDRKTNLIIDKLQTHSYEIPFPSVTICPDIEPTNESIYETIGKLFPNLTHDNKIIMKEVILKLFNAKLTNYKIEWSMEDFDAVEFGDQDALTALLELMPHCKDIFFNCMWNFELMNCCDIFEIQKTNYGYCYSFNSQTSMNISKRVPRISYSSGWRSGLLFNMKSPLLVNNQMPLLIEDPFVFPNRGPSISTGHEYEISLRFITVQSSPEVLELENIYNSPCKYENGTYRIANCQNDCLMNYFQDECGCIPTRFFNSELNKCAIKDVKCLEFAILNMPQYLNLNTRLIDCNCPKECVNYKYEMSIIDRPYEKDAISMNVYFDRKDGTRYKRVIVVTDLDMIVKFGGIFGLFVGGSILALMELILALIKTILSWMHQGYRFLRK